MESIKIHVISLHKGFFIHANTVENFWLSLGDGMGWGYFSLQYPSPEFSPHGGEFRLTEIRAPSEGEPDSVLTLNAQLWDVREALLLENRCQCHADEFQVKKINN